MCESRSRYKFVIFYNLYGVRHTKICLGLTWSEETFPSRSVWSVSCRTVDYCFVEKSKVCSGIDTHYRTHVRCICILYFLSIFACVCSRLHACNSSVPCLTVNCFLLPMGRGSLCTGVRHPGLPSKFPPIPTGISGVGPRSMALWYVPAHQTQQRTQSTM